MGDPGPRHLYTGGHSRSGYHYRDSCDPEPNSENNGTDGCAVDIGVGGADMEAAFALSQSPGIVEHSPEVIYEHTYSARGNRRHWAPHDHCSHSGNAHVHWGTDGDHEWEAGEPPLAGGLEIMDGDIEKLLVSEPVPMKANPKDIASLRELAHRAAMKEVGPERFLLPEADQAERAVDDFLGIGEQWPLDEKPTKAYKAAFQALVESEYT